jgi:hypothetical protein
MLRIGKNSERSPETRAPVLAGGRRRLPRSRSEKTEECAQSVRKPLQVGSAWTRDPYTGGKGGAMMGVMPPSGVLGTGTSGPYCWSMGAAPSWGLVA